MNMTIEEYLEDTKRHLTAFVSKEEILKFGCRFDFDYDEILHDKEYFQECLRNQISSYGALLLYPDYLINKKPLWDNYKNKVKFSSNPFDRKFEYIDDNDNLWGSPNFKILGDYSFSEFFKMLEIDNDFKSRWGNLNDANLTAGELKALRRILFIDENDKSYNNLLNILKQKGETWGMSEFRMCIEMGIPIQDYYEKNRGFNIDDFIIAPFEYLIPSIRDFIQTLDNQQ